MCTIVFTLQNESIINIQDHLSHLIISKLIIVFQKSYHCAEESHRLINMG